MHHPVNTGANHLSFLCGATGRSDPFMKRS
jgi:hypothetical protein